MAILSAPKGAYFVWHDHDLRVPKTMVRDLGREDLVVIGPHSLKRGTEFRRNGVNVPVILDHYTDLTHEQFEVVERVNARVQRTLAYRMYVAVARIKCKVRAGVHKLFSIFDLLG